MTLTQFLEAINGAVVGICAGLIWLFGIYILEELRASKNWRETRRKRAAAIAMFMVFCGEAAIRGCVWAWRHYSLAVDNMPVTIGVGAGVIIWLVGGTCALRHFQPRSYDCWPLILRPWIFIPAISIIAAVALAM